MPDTKIKKDSPHPGKKMNYTAAGAALGLILYLFSATNVIYGATQLVTSRIVFIVAEVFFLFL